MGEKMIELLYEDKFIIVCVKPLGVLSEPFLKEKNLPDLLKKQTRAYKIDVIHRLDRNVSGVMVYSKSSKATLPLAKMMSAHKFEKEYLAVAEGKLPPKGIMEDYLIKDKKNCKVYTANQNNKDAKYAKLEYEVLAEKKNFSLVKVKLYTGRTHQIRVQFSSRGFPLVGDTKYGKQDTKANGKTPIALFSYRLAFRHPISKIPIECTAFPTLNSAFSFFKNEINLLSKNYNDSD